MPDGYRLPVREFWPELPMQALVIALHGFNDYSHAFAGMCEFLRQRQIACVAYDQRGFGATEQAGFWPSEGRHEQDLAVVTELYAARHPGVPLYLAGESMGGAVILSALAGAPEWTQRVQGTILFAPAVWGRSTQPWYQQLALWLTAHVMPGWSPTGRGLGRVATDNIEALRVMGRDPLVIKKTRIDTVYGLTNLMDRALARIGELRHRTLFLYGAKDQIIPRNATCRALKNLSPTSAPVQFVLYPEGYHMLTRDRQAETVFADVVGWLVEGALSEPRVAAATVNGFCSASQGPGDPSSPTQPDPVRPQAQVQRLYWHPHV
jgi:alpha-beta hydrolase superfamily lysophospholipase